MSRVITYNPDGSIASVTDTEASTGGGSGDTGGGSTGPSNGATGTIAASSITNSGSTNLTGNLTVGGTSNLTKAATLTGLTNNGTSALKGNTSVTGTFGVTDTTTLGTTNVGALTATGVTTLSSGCAVIGDLGASGQLTGASLTTSANALVGGDLTVTGPSNVAAVNASGLVTAANLKLNSGGALTFPDGTTQATASTGGGGGAQSNTFATGINITGGAVTYPDGSTQASAPVNMLTSQSAGFGPAVISTTTVDVAGVYCTIPGAPGVIAQFVPTYSTSLMGMSFINNNATALTLRLADQTTSSWVYTVNLPASTASYFGPFTVNQYPMPAGHNFRWNVSANNTSVSNLYLQPMYLAPAASPSYNVSSLATGGLTNVAFSGTAVPVNVMGTSSGMSWKLPKAGSLYSFTVNNQHTNALTVALSVTGVGKPITVSAPANAVTTFGPYAAGTYNIPATVQTYWVVSGSGTGSVYIDTQILFSIA